MKLRGSCQAINSDAGSRSATGGRLGGTPGTACLLLIGVAPPSDWKYMCVMSTLALIGFILAYIFKDER